MGEYRQSGIRKNLELRSRIVDAIRRFFTAEGYLEVETPIRIPAPAPEAYIDAEISGDWFLQTSPELCMKQLLAAGYKKIFQICKCFRKHERGKTHLPELTMLEWYASGQTYQDLMDQCEQLILSVLTELDFSKTLVYQGKKIEFKTPWQRISVTQAFRRHAPLTINDAVNCNRFDEILVDHIEPHLGVNPIYLYDYPASRAALARLKSGNPSLGERFELYIGGLELCNAFSELTDPNEQRMRFEAERNLRAFKDKHVYPLPEKFLNALADLPDAAGIAFGIDRLVMLLADTNSIDDVVTFIPEEL
jgi:lysyl-tRNA synthetase class 2